ncbi:MAG: YIP1 family protein [Pseudomonadota bacterium]
MMARKLAKGVDERIAFVYLALGSVLGFVSQLPGLMRQANEPDPDFEAAILAEAGSVRPIEALSVPADITDAKFEALMSASLFAWVFLLPLLLYALAAMSRLVLRLFKVKISGLDARVSLFWAFLAATPLKLLQGLVAGFVGPGPALVGVWSVWLIVFLFIWISSLSEAAWGVK